MDKRAELVFINAAVFDAPIGADAVAVAQGRILAVGRGEDVAPLAGPRAKVLDLAGGSLLPGFFDPHFHFYEWALKRRQLDLSQAASLDDLLARVAAADQALPPGQWLIGFGWNEVDWPVRLMPKRDMLDKAAGRRPVALWRCDFHLAVANSAALAVAGINRHTPDPAEGRIEKDADGRPNGILRELAINLVRDAAPTPTDAQMVAAMAEAAHAAHAMGITALQDVRLMDDQDGPRALRAARRLEETGRLDLRMWMSLAPNQLDQAISLGLRSGFGGDRLRLGHVKFFADGGMGGRTAWMLSPYLDGGVGMPLIAPADLLAETARAQAAGLAVMIHAVGDRASREVIKVFEQVAARATPGGPGPAIPHRIEHVQNIHPHDLARLGRLPVAACLTPPNLVSDINTVDSSVGERGRWTYALKDILDCGVPTMFSSDCPVCPPEPLFGIRAAVTRQRLDNTPAGGWRPECRVSIAQAITACTAAPAALHGMGGQLGRVAPGYLADLAAFDRDLLATPPQDLHRARIRATVFDGRLVYAADGEFS